MEGQVFIPFLSSLNRQTTMQLGIFSGDIKKMGYVPFSVLGLFGCGFLAILIMYNLDFSIAINTIGVEGLIVASVVASAVIQLVSMISIFTIAKVIDDKTSLDIEEAFMRGAFLEKGVLFLFIASVRFQATRDLEDSMFVFSLVGGATLFIGTFVG